MLGENGNFWFSFEGEFFVFDEFSFKYFILILEKLNWGLKKEKWIKER